MFFTPDRLLVLAVAVTILAADGLRRLVKQRRNEEVAPTAYRILFSVLVAGVVLAWGGFFVVWLGG